MSHIYDALQKSKGRKPPAAPGEGPAQGGEGEGPPQDPPRHPTPPRGFDPNGHLDGGLLGKPNVEFLKELDNLRDNVEVILSRNKRRVISFAASLPGEGSSTLALHFAFLLARVAEKRVLLVDADMARSNTNLTSVVGEQDGLTELLRDGLSLDEVILATEEPNLHFLPAGQDHVRYVEAVSTGRLRKLFEELGELYDTVVVDNAPILEHPEAPLIGAASDGVLLVVRAHETRRELVQRAMAELNFSRCRILGTILNARKESLPGFLRDRV